MDAYIPEVLLRDLVRHERQPSAFLLYFYLWWRTTGQRKQRVALSLQDLANETGLSKRTLQNARRVLLRRKLIVQEAGADATSVPAYRVLKPWTAAATATRATGR